MLKKGFTIVELIVVVGFVAILFVGAVLVINPTRRMGETNDTRRWEDIIGIAKAIELYTIENHALPTDFSTSTLSIGEKFVLCDTPGVLTCDGQSKSCLVVNDADFLGVFLPELPLDPLKSSSADTGYYVTRTATDAIAIGSCSTYDSTATIEQLARASLPAIVSECGDSFVDSDEVCDDGDVFTEQCGNATIETAGTYCNSTCSSVVVISANEVCDSLLTNDCWDSASSQNLYSGSYVGVGTTCRSPKTHCNAACDYCSIGCF